MQEDLIKNSKKVEISPIKNFDLKKYLGNWYEQVRTKNPFEKENSKNIKANYSLTKDNKILIENSRFLNNEKKTVFGSGYLINNKIGEIITTFGKNFLTKYLYRGKYTIIKTDYNNFSFIYSKKTYFFFFTSYYGWILTRDSNPDKDVLENYVNDYISMTGLKRNQLIFVENTEKNEDEKIEKVNNV